jgi:N utilization substance protein A
MCVRVVILVDDEGNVVPKEQIPSDFFRKGDNVRGSLNESVEGINLK